MTVTSDPVSIKHGTSCQLTKVDTAGLEATMPSNMLGLWVVCPGGCASTPGVSSLMMAWMGSWIQTAHSLWICVYTDHIANIFGLLQGPCATGSCPYGVVMSSF